MKSKRVSVIYNPAAGAMRRDPEAVVDLVACLRRRGLDVTCEATARPGHATGLAREAVSRGVDVVLVCGGDGTVNEAVQSLVGTETKLAVWPAGTANVLARELSLTREPAELARLIDEGRALTVSLGRAVKPETGWHRYFLLMAGIGLDATIVQGVDLRLKKLTGIGAYLASGLRFLARMPLTPFAVEFNGRRYDSTFTVIANAAHYAVWFTLAPGARMDDRQFEVCLFNSRSRLAYLGYVLLSLLGRHTRNSGMIYQSAERVSVDSNSQALVQLDGDLVGHLPMRFEVVPEALRIVS